MNNIFEYKTIVQYTDVNENNELSQRGLIRILLEVAGLHSDHAGYGLNQVHITHVSWMILDWKVQSFIKPHWNSVLKIKTWPKSFSRIASYREFEVYDELDNLVAIASSKWVLINTETLSLARLTPKMIACYGNECKKSVFETDLNDKEPAPENSKFIYEYQVKRHDIDTNLHVDNLHYIDYAYDALPDDISSHAFDNIEVIYKKQIKLGAIIKCFYTFDEASQKHIVTIKNDELDTVHSIIKLW